MVTSIQSAKILLLVLLLLAISQPLSIAAKQTEVPNKLQVRKDHYKRPVVIVFEGPIDFQKTLFFKNRLAQAKQIGADLVIVEIDSPGGYAAQSLEMAEMLRDVDWAYTVAFIPREAISGAALMSLGCDEIILGAQARFGDAGPIALDPMAAAYRNVPAKIKSVLVRQTRDLAASKGRSEALAEAMIDEKAVVYSRPQPNSPNGELEFKTVYLDEKTTNPVDAAKKANLDLQEWQLVEETGSERIFTVNGPRAVSLGFADALADDRVALAEDLGFELPVPEYRFKLKDSIVYWLNTPFVTGLLIVLGLLALYFELSAPGIGAGGLIACLCATLFFWSRFAGGTSGWLEVILFFAGIIFLLMEVFVIPGFGIAGFLGLLLLFASIVMASQNFVVPETPAQFSSLTTTLSVVAISAAMFMIGAGILSYKFGAIPILGRLSLRPPQLDDAPAIDKDTGKALPVSHPEVSVGDWGVADSLLRPAGRVIFNGKSIDVVSDGSYLEPGTQVKVTEISGNRIVVSEVEKNLTDT